MKIILHLKNIGSTIIFALVSEWRMRALLPVVGTVYSQVSTTLLICYPEKYMPNTPIQALKQPAGQPYTFIAVILLRKVLNISIGPCKQALV